MSEHETTQDRQLIAVQGDLVLAALCVGQFHAPCQIEAERLLVQADGPLRQVLQTLGLKVDPVEAPFTPVPFFPPEASAPRRGVHTHVSHDPDDYAPSDPAARGSNA
ncbi:hypothetical protein [Paenirhodobacter sp.]|uniref:urease accessory protein UreE C-terminal domain-containing protein n=1 Tax=Paenirhodobacter sp. TaxID=1965326 RepID=UPI003B5145C4